MLTLESQRTLGVVDPAQSRQNWARSATAVAADGRVCAYHADILDGVAWTASLDDAAVSMVGDERRERLVVGERGPDAGVSLLSAETGERRWRHAATEEVGVATRDSLLFQPYVVDVGLAGETVVAAARRYDRDGEDRAWSSAVVGFDPDGTVRWRYPARASPIGLAVDDDRVAVAYNRCTDHHDHGLVVLDAATGEPVTRWDPGTPGDRRVGDVAFADGDLAVASHGDRHGYLLDADGTERWRVDLASERTVEGETVYAYPNHVCVADGTAVFVTGNTYAESTRDPGARHPREHTATAVADGERSWSHDVGGFARGVSTANGRVAVPSAQHFRRRSVDAHAVHLFDADEGHLETRSVSGIASAVALGGERLAAVEEPVAYHDDEHDAHGAYRLHAWRVGDPSLSE
jgi:outer membrane protein assembly factor BamB